MPNIVIESDGTIQGTKMKIDGEEVTKDGKVVSLYLDANAPWKSRYSGDTYGGSVSAGYMSVDDNGLAERKIYFSNTTNYSGNVGVKVKDNKIEDDIIRYIGDEADTKISQLVDKIVEHCKENKIKCPDKETLLNRTEQSLCDKLNDYGVDI